MQAGRSLPVMFSAVALFATWFGSETVFGASSEFLKGGLFAVIEDPFGAALCLILFGTFFARKLYSMNLLTLGDFFKIRFGRKTELVASIFLAPPYIGYIAAQLVAMGLILHVVVGLPLWVGVVISAFVVTFYTYIGGMWAISVTDFFQSIIIISGMIVLAFVLSKQAGGVGAVLGDVPAQKFRFLPSLTGKDITLYFAAWSVLGLGSIPSQDVFQRVTSSNSASTAVKSCFIAAGLYLTIAQLPLFISLCTEKLYPGQIGIDTQVALPKMVLAHTGVPIQALFFGSLLSAIMSTTSSAILAPAAIFSENVVKPLSKSKLSDSQMLVLTRISVLLFAGTATLVACFRSDIYHLVGESSILSLVTLFAPMVFGMYWKKSSATGALLSMILGFCVWLLFEILQTGWPSLVPGLIAGVAAMIVGSYLWPALIKSE
jgi:solute:Na+ symporter, SSS family